MQGYYTVPPTYHEHTPASSTVYPSGSSISYRTLPPEYRAHVDAFQHAQHSEQHRHSTDRNHDRRPSQIEEPANTLGPDPEFMRSLRSIGATQQSPGQSCIARSNSPSESESMVAETIVRARKSWKTVKGCNEPVWPPELEKVLVQALLSYRPDDAQFARALGRFPKRNRYISDYIYAATGVRRTPKQVGSRLQQLKDVSCGKMLLNHVASWAQAPSSASSMPAPSSTDVIPLESLSVCDYILSGIQGYTPGSDGSQSPETPLGAVDQEPPFLPASSGEMSHPYPIHPQVVFSQADWFPYGHNLPEPSQL